MTDLPCPHCGTPNNTWLSTDGDGSSTDGVAVEAPTADAISLCFHCGGLCIYTDATHIRVATVKEQAEYENDPLVARSRKILGYTDSPRLALSLLLMDVE